MWRVFANCVKYNSHPNNKDAVPSFVSIALHLREYFNNLWQEYMLPSDPPQRQAMTDDDDAIAAHEVLKASFAKRDEDRKIRLENSGVLVLSKTFTTKASSLLLQFIENGGCVDGLDTKALFGPGSGVDGREVELVIQRLGQYQAQLEEIAQSGSVEYTLDAFYSDLSKCYTEDVLEDNPAMRNRFSNRIDRFFWKQAVPLHEANSRGVTQSSIWGNLAATIWARESSKKPYWPALCLGILPPAEQREGWHQAVTERNEGRLPEKLRGQLMVAKGRCEQAQKRQSLSYFLVEFLGTHEFIWVRETDIIENFDPNTDPNKSVSGSKKSRSSRSNASNVVGSKTYATALQECVWANEEYENVLQDAFENSGAEDDEDDDVEMDNSFHALAQSDEEADEEGIHGYQYEEDAMAMSDVDEANWLITHDGMLDASTVGRKNAKKRAQAMKKKPSTKKEALAKKEESPKKKRSKSKDKKDSKETEKVKDPKERERQEKKEHRELEKRRKKRLREHEKSLRNEARKKTKRRRSGPNDPDECERGLSHNKRARATAIVKAYLTRMAKQDDCKSLALSGVMTMPAALVDSTGLLGMALAFRAASGELCMPDDGKEQLSKLKPWTTIETEKPKSSTERTENLQKQIELLEKEIGRVRNDTEKRKFLASEYVSKRLLADSVIDADDLAARQNHFKKKKKSTPSKSEQGGDESPDKSEEAAKGRPFEMEDDGVSDRNAEDDAMAQADDQSESDLGESVDVSPDGKHEPGLEDRLEENVAEAMK
jgi:PWWP domain